ncbi:hypothetical protein B0H15DRAFT_850685 [Mycena belliarum]|uniref:Secreted protein n=1 Tax=Mycena belliarum TaxID=1033014 RepID=A0AAD6TZ52_9AGAR|nr:hypothetical protein B0H15DRAFT_850685 [Mycena belliae]
MRMSVSFCQSRYVVLCLSCLTKCLLHVGCTPVAYSGFCGSQSESGTDRLIRFFFEKVVQLLSKNNDEDVFIGNSLLFGCLPHIH